MPEFQKRNAVFPRDNRGGISAGKFLCAVGTGNAAGKLPAGKIGEKRAHDPDSAPPVIHLLQGGDILCGKRRKGLGDKQAAVGADSLHNSLRRGNAFPAAACRLIIQGGLPFQKVRLNSGGSYLIRSIRKSQKKPPQSKAFSICSTETADPSFTVRPITSNRG